MTENDDLLQSIESKLATAKAALKTAAEVAEMIPHHKADIRRLETAKKALTGNAPRKVRSDSGKKRAAAIAEGLNTQKGAKQ